MNQARSESQRSFAWQGLFILLPVAALAVVGLVSLRQDRLIAEAEARQSAQQYANDFSRIFTQRLTGRASLDEPQAHSFHLDPQGRLLFPAQGPQLPHPHNLDLTSLTPDQSTQWNDAFQDWNNAAALAAIKQLLDQSLSPDLSAALHFRRAILLIATGQTPDAVLALQRARDLGTNAVTENGLPLAPLAQFKLLTLTAGQGNTATNVAVEFNELSSNLVTRPIYLTPPLLEQLRQRAYSLALTNVVEPWQQEWQRQETLRSLARASSRQFNTRADLGDELVPAFESTMPALFWLEARNIPPFIGNSRPQAYAANLLPKENRPSPRNIVARLPVKETGPSQSETKPATEQTGPENSSNGMSDVTFTVTPDYLWLVNRVDDGAKGSWIVCRWFGPAAENRALLDENAGVFWSDLRKDLPTLPPWFGWSLEIAGRTLTGDQNMQTVALKPTMRGTGAQWTPIQTLARPEILAASTPSGAIGTETSSAAAHSLLHVNIHLVSPQLLYARQESRTRLYGFLIGASALVALAGFVSARRAFRRQQQLASMKSNFVSSVSHELRAPIASVRLLAESLERGAIKDPARQHDYFSFIVQECRRLGTLIENVLDFARIEQGRKDYEFEPVDVPALLRQTIRLLEPTAAERQVALQLDLPDSELTALEPPPRLDAQAIQQAIVNLLDNALKHSPPGESIVVGLRVETPPPAPGAEATTGRRLLISVSDRGSGIPAAEHERIFERFYRRGSELRRETQGVGIGLSIVKHVAEAHRGRVLVNSQPGQGSRFTLNLPFTPDQLA